MPSIAILTTVKIHAGIQMCILCTQAKQYSTVNNESTKVQTLYCFICNTVESAYGAEGEIPPAVALVAAVLEDRGLFLVVVFGGHH